MRTLTGQLADSVSDRTCLALVFFCANDVCNACTPCRPQALIPEESALFRIDYSALLIPVQGQVEKPFIVLALFVSQETPCR